MKSQQDSAAVHLVSTMRESAENYRNMMYALIAQLSDEELHRRPAADVNSVAVVIKHLGGNLQSRWTDFRTTDGEKPNRNRDGEFEDWNEDRKSLLAHFELGWRALQAAFDDISIGDLGHKIQIRGEDHTIAQALDRSVSHVAYHIGQIALLARLVHEGEWQWLTIAPGKSEQHNEEHWGASTSRGVNAATESDQ